MLLTDYCRSVLVLCLWQIQRCIRTVQGDIMTFIRRSFVSILPNFLFVYTGRCSGTHSTVKLNVCQLSLSVHLKIDINRTWLQACRRMHTSCCMYWCLICCILLNGCSLFCQYFHITYCAGCFPFYKLFKLLGKHPFDLLLHSLLMYIWFVYACNSIQ